MAMELQTACADCRLRPWRVSDIDDIVRHADNRKVWRNLTDLFPHPYTRDDAAHWVHIATQLQDNSLHLAIEWQGRAVGGIGVIAGGGMERHVGTLGYWLGESLWGRGLATAVVRALAPHALEASRWRRLESPVFAWNPASMRVLEKAGFQREGVRRRGIFKDGEFVDVMLYARLRPDDEPDATAP